MNRFALYFISGVAVAMLAGCADFGSNEIHVVESQKPNPNAVKVKSLASIRISGYVDHRNASTPRKIGITEERVTGLSGKDLILDRDLTEVVADSLRKRLDDTGTQILGKDDSGVALFELSGVIEELKYDVKVRDQVFIKIQSTLKEVSTGNLLWSGEVEQKDDRFAGVSGNSKGDIADYLKKELGVVTGKTVEAINTVLMATHPELFNLTPGTKAIPGVTVFVSPGVQPETSVLPHPSAPDTSLLQPLNGAPGVLVIRTEPARAKVYLDGVYYGMSPLNIESAAGIRSVEVKLKGYKKATEKVAVRIGATTELEFQLEK